MSKPFVLGSLVLASVVAIAGCSTGTAGEDNGESDNAFSKGAAGQTKVLLLPWTYAAGGSADAAKADSNAFNNSAVTLTSFYNKTYYPGKSFSSGSPNPNITTVPIGTHPEDLLKALATLKAAGKKFDRVVTLSHGGVDGPVFSEESGEEDADQGFQIGWDYPNDRLCKSATQIEADACSDVDWYRGVRESRTKVTDPSETAALETQNLQALVDLGTLIHDITNDGAFVWLGACNPGHNTTNVDRSVNFVQMMACISGRETYGTTNKTTAVDMAKDVQALESTLAHKKTIATATADAVTSSKLSCAVGGAAASVKSSGDSAATTDAPTDPPTAVAGGGDGDSTDT